MPKKKKTDMIEIDPLLAPYRKDLERRMEYYSEKKKELLGGESSLTSFANGSLYYGFHCAPEGWYYREWAPHAQKMSLIGDFNGWNGESNPMKPVGNGNWEVFIPGRESLPHMSCVKVRVTADSKSFDRIPAYIHRVIQQEKSSNFNGQIWNPPCPYEWKNDRVKALRRPPVIYECHIGMASEEPKIATYEEFRRNILPYIQKNGYTAIQLMAVMEHPYYASFGYQVTNFFAASSRYGTPEELKALIDEAHGMGLAVFLDLIHSHAAGNALEGLNYFDGTSYQYFHEGGQGDHPAWGTKLFDYGKKEVLHFLLSNLKYWMEEYRFDGFRFDGVTSMLYHNHGLGECFDSYQKYFSMNTDIDAVYYLQLANELIKELDPQSVTIAEDMSGMPGMCIPVKKGGLGFDYRLAMGVPDFWIHTVKQRDEDWDLGRLWYELTTRRPREKNIGYCESHDQALVGDKTLMFWLADKEMYWHMAKDSRNAVIDRAIALHKLIRLSSFSLAGEGYLNFMGNEFGHPEWVDFPREGNQNSYQYARRQWSLVKSPFLCYEYLLRFDNAMIGLLKKNQFFRSVPVLEQIDHQRRLLCYRRGKLLFAFNFHWNQEMEVCLRPSEGCRLYLALDSGWQLFGGEGRRPRTKRLMVKNGECFLRLPPRTAVVCQEKEEKSGCKA